MSKKKNYQKPEIKKVALTPEEAVLTFCKAAIGGNRSVGKCQSAAKCTNKTPGS